MIHFASCVAYPDLLEGISQPGVKVSMNGEVYDYFSRQSNGWNIFPIYQALMDTARERGAEALVLLHEDLQFRDPELASKIRETFKDPSIAIIGCVGARHVKSLNWWEGDKRGHVVDTPHGVHDYGFDGGRTCDVDSVDGMFFILSPWALENLTLTDLGYEGLHGSVEELCFQARSKGKRVVVTRIEATHHTRGGVAGDLEAYNRNSENFIRRWIKDAPPPPDPWAAFHGPGPHDVEAVYAAERGRPVLATPGVMIATPAYNPPELEFLTAREAIVHDLASNNVGYVVLTTPGDSLVMRGRHAIMHEFLRSDATHLLFVDADIVPLEPAVVRKMMATGHEIIGGACPFRSDHGHVVVNIRREDKVRQRIDTDDTGSAIVNEIGTGFLLMARTALVAMCEAHPELLYFSDHPDPLIHGSPMWALFDTKIENQRFLSEDYFFCQLWREMGGLVHVYVPFEASHWGRKAFRGSFMAAMKMREAPAEA